VSRLTVWRLCAAKYAESAFSGEGARRFGGRWSSVGMPVVYASESRSLAVLELLANVEFPEALAATAWVVRSAHVPLAGIEKPTRVPASWRQYPRSTETQAFGDAWLRTRQTLALRVPSAVVPGEFNYLLNPAHPDFDQVELGPPEPFSFDPRLARPA
jgi:RES domain-containing protein